MREDARWLAVYGAAFVRACGHTYTLESPDAVRNARRVGEFAADAELATRSEHPFPKEP